MLVTWNNVVPTAVSLSKRLKPIKTAVDSELARVITPDPVGVYVDWAGRQASIDCDAPAVLDRVASVLPCGVNRHNDASWVKVAYSPFVRGAGELLNFLPGPKNTLPGLAGPLAGGLTAGLLGAGAGYFGGKLVSRFMPDRWNKKRLPVLMGVLGGAIGPTIGGWAVADNIASGRPFYSKELFDGSRLDVPKMGELSDARLEAGWNAIKEAFSVDHDVLNAVRSGARDGVNVDGLSRGLWEAGASPQLAGATMGVIGAAQQMPGGIGPGWVTPMQMGQLAMGMGAGYVSGAIAGKVLGALVGMPDSTQDKLKQTGTYLGLVRNVVPMVYGR